MQTKPGGVPDGFVAMEFQELQRLCIIPTVEAFCAKHFVAGANDWFKIERYNAWREAVGHPLDSARPCVAYMMDDDGRHTKTFIQGWQKMRAAGQTPRNVDRRTIPEGEYGWIRWEPYQVVPSAPKCPDCLQMPIELVFAVVKPYWHKLRISEHATTVQELWGLVVRAFNEKATPELIRKNYEHALKAIRVWSGEQGTWVTIDGQQYMCTGGGVVPKKLRA